MLTASAACSEAMGFSSTLSHASHPTCCVKTFVIGAFDRVAGCDFGMIRAEAEIAYKKAKIDETELDANIGPALGEGGKARSVSAMVNAMLDFGDDDGWSG